MKIVYIVGGNLAANGMSQVLIQKINYLAQHTEHQLYMVLTEKAGAPFHYPVDERVEYVNFDINFDELDTMPLYKKVVAFRKKQATYKRLLTDYLMRVKADVVVSALRREIAFLLQIKDGSKKVGELHFCKSVYRNFQKSFLPSFVNNAITHFWRKPLFRAIAQLDAFVVLTHVDKEDWADFKNVRVINNPIKYFPDRHAECTSKRIISVGRYSPEKGFDMLLTACQKVAKLHPDWHLHIYGPGENDKYQQMAAEMGVADFVTCHSAVDNVYDKYLESSVYVLSSRYEGFGLVLAEAMSCGVPCVSFDCPCGPREIVLNEKNGLLVPFPNTDALADGIIRMIEDMPFRMEMSKGAVESAERFRVDNIMKQWTDLFASLTNA